MARLGGVLLLGLVAVFCQKSLADYSRPEVYDKLKRLFQDDRIADIAEQVKRDMEAEKAREKEEKKSDLLNQLARALQEKREEHPHFAEREEISDREYSENKYDERSDLPERDDESLYKRLVLLLKRGELREENWFKTKPERTGLEGYQKCFLTKNENKFETIMPNECRWVHKNNNKWTTPCKSFCNEWTKAIMENNEDTTGVCKYDNEYQKTYCDKVTCQKCESNPEAFLYCCGTCLRKKCELDKYGMNQK